MTADILQFRRTRMLSDTVRGQFTEDISEAREFLVDNLYGSPATGPVRDKLDELLPKTIVIARAEENQDDTIAPSVLIDKKGRPVIASDEFVWDVKMNFIEREGLAPDKISSRKLAISWLAHEMMGLIAAEVVSTRLNTTEMLGAAALRGWISQSQLLMGIDASDPEILDDEQIGNYRNLYAPLQIASGITHFTLQGTGYTELSHKVTESKRKVLQDIPSFPIGHLKGHLEQYLALGTPMSLGDLRTIFLLKPVSDNLRPV